MKIAVWNILDMVEEYGEDAVKEILSDFSCETERDGEIVFSRCLHCVCGYDKLILSSKQGSW